MPEQPDDLQSNGEPIDLVYFFIPLAEPLPLPDHFVLEFHEQPSHDDWMAALEAGKSISLGYPKRFTSLLFWQTSVEDSDPFGFGSAAETAAKAFPNLQRPSTDPAPFPRPETIVEAAVQLAPFDGETPDDDVLSEALDRALDCVRGVQRACGLLHQWPVTLATLERMPPMLPMALRLGVEPDAPPSWPEGFELFLANTNVPLTPGQEVDQTAHQQLGEVVELFRSGRVFSRYPDFVREAVAARRRHGDYKVGVVLAATAAEILLDDLLMHLMWEEATRPEEAAPVFEQGLITRVKMRYHERLGGNWQLDGRGPVHAWHRDLAALRNRVVHAGYEPTRQEVEKAHDAMFALEKFVVGRLLDPRQLARYPRTAAMLVGEPGLARRGLMSDRLKDLVADPEEPSWPETFLRWRGVVAQCRADSAGQKIDPRPDQAVTIAVISTAGHVTWWLHDREANLACAAQPPDLPPGQRANLDRVVETVQGKANEPVSVAFAKTKADPVTPVDWVFPYRVLPLAGVMVDRSDLG